MTDNLIKDTLTKLADKVMMETRVYERNRAAGLFAIVRSHNGKLTDSEWDMVLDKLMGGSKD